MRLWQANHHLSGTYTICALPDRPIIKPTDSALNWENPEVRVYIGPGLSY